MKRLLLSVLVACFVVVASPAWPQEAPKRVALVIANSSYEQAPRLENPAADARVVSEALLKAGFFDDLKENLGLKGFGAALRSFKRKADDADVALIYFAGHGLELDGQNWLIPTDAKLEDPADAQTEAISIEQMLRYVSSARRLRVIVLDACRDNPFKFKVATRSAVIRGLKPVENLPAGTVVAYSAGPGQRSLDGKGSESSPFAEAFSKRLREPGLEIGLLFRAVYADVVAASRAQTQGKYVQEPWYNMALSAEQIVFVPDRTPEELVQSEAFLAASREGTAEAWRRFLERWPKGPLAPNAKVNLDNLTGINASLTVVREPTGSGRSGSYESLIVPAMIARAEPPSGGWTPAQGVERDALFAKAAALVPAQLETTRIDLAALPFYDNVKLVRMIDKKWSNEQLVAYYPVFDGNLYWLNGKSPPIHELNAKAKVRINQNNVLDYLKFFCFFVRGEDCPFYVLDSEQDVWLNALSKADRDEAIEYMRSPRFLGWNEKSQLRVDAHIIYAKHVLTAQFVIHTNGMIEMIKDEPVTPLTSQIDQSLR